MRGVELANHLRLVASHHMGTDLADRLAHAVRTQQKQREALTAAAAEIEALVARVLELERLLADDGELPASAVPGLG